MAIGEFHFERRVRKGLDDHTVLFNRYLFRHLKLHFKFIRIFYIIKS